MSSKDEKETNKTLVHLGLHKSGGNIVSYFCDSDARVLEIAVGPASPTRLRQSADRALELNHQLENLTEKEQLSLARRHYLKLCGTQNVEKFESYITFKQWRGADPIDVEKKPNIDAVVRAALFSIEEWTFGRAVSWRDKRFESYPEVFPATRNQFGKLDRHSLQRASNDTLLYKENLPLAEYPLIQIGEIEKAVFQILVGQPYSVLTRDYEEKLASFKRFRNAQKHILLVLTDAPSRLSAPFMEPDLDEFWSFNSIISQQDDFGILTVTYDEMFGILSDTGSPPLNEKLENREIRKKGLGFVIFDDQGNAAKLLPSGYQYMNVGRTMRRIRGK